MFPKIKSIGMSTKLLSLLKKPESSIVTEGIRTKLSFFFKLCINKIKRKETKEIRKTKTCVLTSYQDVLVFSTFKNK